MRIDANVLNAMEGAGKSGCRSSPAATATGDGWFGATLLGTRPAATANSPQIKRLGYCHLDGAEPRLTANTRIWLPQMLILEWPMLIGFVLIGLAVMYRYAPSRDTPKWKWVSPGADATLWILVSIGFTVYVAHFNSSARHMACLVA
jgi:hypothetical protein